MNTSNRQRTVFVVLAWLIVPGITILSFLPYGDKRILHTHGRFHEWGHVAAFSVIALIAARLSQSRSQRVSFFFAALVFGWAIEVGEHFVFHSPLEWKDMLADSLGVIGGTLIALLFADGNANPLP